MKDYFEGRLIGQKRVRKQLSLYLDVYKKTSVFRNLLFVSAKGNGKTMLAQVIGEQLEKPYYEVNAGAIRSVIQFYEELIEPLVLDRECTLMLDELHCLDRRVGDFLLSMLAPSKTNQNIVRVGAAEFVIDFSQFTFLAATTESQRLFPALKDRLTQVMLSNYSPAELMQIVQLHALPIRLSPNVLEFLAQYVRGNARSAMKLGNEIKGYALVHGEDALSMGQAKELIEILNLYEFGFSELEVRILEAIGRARSSSLTRLAAKSGLTPSAQRDLEREMLAHDLIEIDGGRHITRNGISYLTRNPIKH